MLASYERLSRHRETCLRFILEGRAVCPADGLPALEMRMDESGEDVLPRLREFLKERELDSQQPLIRVVRDFARDWGQDFGITSGQQIKFSSRKGLFNLFWSPECRGRFRPELRNSD